MVARSNMRVLHSSSRHVEAFLEMMTVERGASANTIEAYERDLEDFSSFLSGLPGVSDGGIAVEAAESNVIRAYLTGLSRRGLAPRTTARRLAALRQFHRFLLAEMGKKGRGFARFMDPTENPEEVAVELAGKLKSPVLTDISIDWGKLKVSEVTPAVIPDLFAGDSIRILGKIEGIGTLVTPID